MLDVWTFVTDIKTVIWALIEALTTGTTGIISEFFQDTGVANSILAISRAVWVFDIYIVLLFSLAYVSALSNGTACLLPAEKLLIVRSTPVRIVLNATDCPITERGSVTTSVIWVYSTGFRLAAIYSTRCSSWTTLDHLISFQVQCLLIFI